MMSPSKAERLTRRAYQLHRAGQPEQAFPLYRKVLESYPMAPVPLHYAALAARQMADAAHAKDSAAGDAALRLMAASIVANPHSAAALHNFGKCLQDRGQAAEARQAYEAAVQLDPDMGESWTNLGQVFGELGNRMRAEACWNRAMDCARPTPEARFNLSFLRLMRGDYVGGWADYESRWDSVTFLYNHGRPDLTAPRWNGAHLEGTLYLHGEQGAGDILMMARYIPAARERCTRLVVELASPLIPLFRATWPDLEIATRGEVAPAHDAHLPMMSLPYVMGTDSVEKVPDPAPFRLATADIRPEPGRIGLCWKGSPTHTNDRLRSIGADVMRPLLEVPGLTWQSLQYGEPVTAPLDPLPGGDFLETAKAIARCELVVTVDTSVAHLAASMGVETWILLPFSAEWRWLQDRSDSPWYPSALLWRQTAAGDWPALVAQVARTLGAYSTFDQE